MTAPAPSSASTVSATSSMTSASSAFLRPHLLRSATFLLPAVVSLLFLSLGMGFSALAGLSMVGGSGGRPIIGPEVAGGMTLLGLGGVVVTGLAWIISLFVPVLETIGEGARRIVDGAGGAASARDAIAEHLGRRCPDWKLRPSDLEGHPALSVNDRDGNSSVVMARAIGPDLRISWTVGRVRSTSTLVLDQFPGKRGADLLLLDADSASAMAMCLEEAVGRVAQPRPS